jgi:hypothetical protein
LKWESRFVVAAFIRRASFFKAHRPRSLGSENYSSLGEYDNLHEKIENKEQLHNPTP